MSDRKEKSLCTRYNGIFRVGAAVDSEKCHNYHEIISKHFNSITPENDMKFEIIHPHEQVFSWKRMDDLCEYARENNCSVRGHTLLWHEQIPNWVKIYEGDLKQLKKVLCNHITTVVDRYRNIIDSWDVVNEVFSDENGEILRKTLWSCTMEEKFIDYAFLAAKEAAPKGLFFLKQLIMKTESYYMFMGWKSLLAIEGKETVHEPFKSIRFEQVSFSYPNCSEQVLHNVSFEIRAGEKVLLIGNNGSGKSTLLKILLRLYEPTEGRIYLNERLISEYSQEEYYKTFSLLPQNYVNYAFTIKENILCKEVDIDDDRRVMESIEKADLSNVVEHLPNGIETYLTKQFDINGIELSAGEWQKMAMARFFCKEAKFKILDEPSSSLDVFSQNRTLSQMVDEKENTVIIVSHRLIEMMNISRVISLYNGKIVEDDTPQCLEKENGFYALWKSTNLNE